jgi:hypothetical protein
MIVVSEVSRTDGSPDPTSVPARVDRRHNEFKITEARFFAMIRLLSGSPLN